MISAHGQRSIDDALHFGNALLKFISPNDAGLTGSHQCGFYLPVPVWEMYTPHSPRAGRNDKHPISILWQDGRITDSVIRLFKNIDEFIHTALSILNRRKARAGRSFENHIEYLLTKAGIPHKMRPALGADGRPDIVIPDEKAYFDLAWPEEKLFVIGLKTTCKDRWRQVLNEGRRVRSKHILTLQQGITGNQLKEMREASVSLVVPKPLHKRYPEAWQHNLLDVQRFIENVKLQLASPTE